MPNIVLVAGKKYEPEAEQLKEWLLAEGHLVEFKILQDISDSQESSKSAPLDISKTDLAISLGGDGAILHTVEVVSDSGIPVLGINYGQLGYLAEVEPQNTQNAITQFFNGDYEIEERMRLSATTTSKKENKRQNALNEIFLGKIHSGHTIRFSISIDDKPFLSYEADGMIVSTPTGSTAYSLSAGGPVIAPELEVMVITPVAPHMIFDRSFVLSPDSEFRLDVEGGYAAEFSMDGFSMGDVSPGESVCITKAKQPAQLVTLKKRDFHKILKSKFGLKDR